MNRPQTFIEAAQELDTIVAEEIARAAPGATTTDVMDRVRERAGGNPAIGRVLAHRQLYADVIRVAQVRERGQQEGR